LIFVDDNNQLSHIGPEIAGPALRSDTDATQPDRNHTDLASSSSQTPDGQPLAEGC
jgi:aspartate 1-decarboxylase